MSLSVDEGRRRLEELRERRLSARGDLEALDAERRALLRQLLEQGVSQAELARWEGVTQWAVAQAVRKDETSAPPKKAARTL